MSKGKAVLEVFGMDGQGLFGSGPVVYGCQGAAAFGGELFGKDR